MPDVDFEFVVEGRPLSGNTRRKQTGKHSKWRDKVRQRAKNQWQTDARRHDIPTAAEVEVNITTYYTELALDVDNVIKDILDSMNGVLYHDDRQIHFLTSRRIDLEGYLADSPSDLLTDALDTSTEFVHIEVSWASED
jgi:Holliday junction resolvase RusA-like endonuclease